MKKERLLLLTLALIQFTHVMDFMIIMPLGNQLMQLFQVGPAEFGLIVSSYNITAGITGFFGAFFIDHYDRKKVLSIGYAGFLVGTLACGLAPNFLFMLFARILTGMFGGILSVLAFSIIADAIPAHRRATAMGFVTSGFSMASVFGVPFGNFLASVYSWHAPFLFIACAGLFVMAAIRLYIPSLRAHIQKKDDRPGPIQIIVSLWKNLNQRKALFLMFLIMMGQFTVVPFIAPSMEKNVGFSQVEVTWIYLFGGLCTVVFAPLIGRLADKKGRKFVFTIASVVALAPILLITNMGPGWPVWAALIVTSLFFIVVSGRMVPAMAIITETTLPQNRGSFMSFNSSVQQLSAGFAAFLAGTLIYENKASSQLEGYNYAGVLAAVAIIISLWAIRRVHKATEEEQQQAASH